MTGRTTHRFTHTHTHKHTQTNKTSLGNMVELTKPSPPPATPTPKPAAAAPTAATTSASIPTAIPEGEDVITFSSTRSVPSPLLLPTKDDNKNGQGGLPGLGELQEQQQQRPQPHRRQRERRERKPRTKQWSDGVVFMTTNPQKKEVMVAENKLPVVNETTVEEWRQQFAKELGRRSTLKRRDDGTDPVVNLAIPTTHDVDRHVKEEHGADSWRYKTLEFIHNRKVQYVLMGLLLLDVIILFVEVTLMALFPFCEIIVRDAISCTPVADGGDDNDGQTRRWLAGSVDGSYGYEICRPGEDGTQFEPAYEYPAGCDSHKWHTVHVLEYVLFGITIIILTVFFVELNVLMVVLTPNVFFRQIFYLLDYIIIGLSIVLEIVFKVYHEELTSALVGMMVIFRSWRYVRISHGIMEVTMELSGRKFERLLNYTEQLERMMLDEGMDLPQDEKVTKLRETNECELAAEIRRHHAEAKRLQKVLNDEQQLQQQKEQQQQQQQQHDGTRTTFHSDDSTSEESDMKTATTNRV